MGMAGVVTVGNYNAGCQQHGIGWEIRWGNHSLSFSFPVGQLIGEG
jgi:hypothetical protein